MRAAAFALDTPFLSGLPLASVSPIVLASAETRAANSDSDSTGFQTPDFASAAAIPAISPANSAAPSARRVCVNMPHLLGWYIAWPVCGHDTERKAGKKRRARHEV